MTPGNGSGPKYRGTNIGPTDHGSSTRTHWPCQEGGGCAEYGAEIRQGASRAGERDRMGVDGGGKATHELVWTKAYPREEEEDITSFAMSRAHHMLVEVYGDHLHQNYGTHMDSVIVENDICQHNWIRMAAKSSRWYAMTPGTARRHFTDLLEAYSQGFLDYIWNYDTPIVFTHVVLIKIMGIRSDRRILNLIRWRIHL